MKAIVALAFASVCFGQLTGTTSTRRLSATSTCESCVVVDSSPRVWQLLPSEKEEAKKLSIEVSNAERKVEDAKLALRSAQGKLKGWQRLIDGSKAPKQVMFWSNSYYQLYEFSIDYQFLIVRAGEMGTGSVTLTGDVQ